MGKKVREEDLEENDSSPHFLNMSLGLGECTAHKHPAEEISKANKLTPTLQRQKGFIFCRSCSCMAEKEGGLMGTLYPQMLERLFGIHGIRPPELLEKLNEHTCNVIQFSEH